MGEIMKHSVDLKKYNLRTDLIIDKDDKFKNDFNEEVEGIKVLNVELNDNDALKLNKKIGRYITIEFSDVTDKNNRANLELTLTKHLKEIISSTTKKNENCLIIGLGNKESTPDSLGPKVIENITITRHLYLLNMLDPEYRIISAFIPGVSGTTGIETKDLIKNAIDSVKPDFIIVIDALASSSIERVNKTIQITNTGISPGSGVGNSRKELSFDTLGIPVIALGIPTVVDLPTIVSDTIKYMHKNYAFNKEFINNPINKLVSPTKINYLKNKIDIKDEDKSQLLGLVGTLSEYEIKELIKEVLTPIGYNMMITPKEIDFDIKCLSSVISNSINESLKKTNNC